MARVVLAGYKGLPAHETRYGLRRPRVGECIEMGWKSVRARGTSEDCYAEMNKWCEDNVHWSEYRWDYFTIYFKNERDQLMFILRWS